MSNLDALSARQKEIEAACHALNPHVEYLTTTAFTGMALIDKAAEAAGCTAGEVTVQHVVDYISKSFS
jgi:hypothetical protein